jgi:hypothetical protein
MRKNLGHSSKEVLPSIYVVGAVRSIQALNYYAFYAYGPDHRTFFDFIDPKFDSFH